MIPIKIGTKKHKIKTIDELNTAEFIELGKIEKPDILKYVSWQTGVTNDKAFFAVISPVVEKAIGQIPDITKLPFSKKFDKKKIIDTVGQRHQIESSKITGYELLVLCLAVAQGRTNNATEINELVQKYMKMSFIDVLPSGFFFFKNFSSGKKKGIRLLLWQAVLTKIRSLKDRLVQIS